MTRVVATIEVKAPIDDVWQELSDLSSHGEWMGDISAFEFIGERRQGTGTRMRVRTDVGPFHTVDVIEVTAWEPPARMAVAHLGRVTGAGEFVLGRAGPSTRLVWRESLHFPWYWGGPVAGWTSRPILRRVFAGNLARLKDKIEA